MREPLSVLFVLGANGYGGTELQARALIQGLVAHGVTVQVVLLDGQEGVEGLPEGTRVLHRGRPPRLLAIGMYLVAVWQVRRMLRRRRFDVVHGIHARGYLVVAFAAFGTSGVRRVAWRRNRGVHLSGSAARVTSVLEKVSLRMTDAVIANSQDVRDYWIEEHGAAPERTVVIPNFLADWRFDVAAPHSGRDVQIVTVGNLRPVKGHATLVRAVAGLRTARPRLVIVGEGQCRPELTRLAEQVGVDLQLVGVQPDPRPWLASPAIYVQPSMDEGSSNAVLEAMAAGLPIVATRVGGMQELLGDAGVLVEAGDEEGLGAAIDGLLGSEARRRALGEAARKRAGDMYSEEAVVAATLDVYRGVVCAAS